MGGIPVLNDTQMTALRRIVGTNQKFDLTVAPQGKSRRLPSYPEEETAASTEGMFRVTEHPDGTVSVTGGLATLGRDSLYTVADVTLARTTPATQIYILLLFPRARQPFFSFAAAPNEGYTPGEQLSWPLARLSNVGIPFAQLWQGGMIDFSLRYYVG